MAIKKEAVKATTTTTTTKGKSTSKTSTALVAWDEKFAKFATKAKEQVKNIGGGTSIKFGRGSITIGGSTVPDGRFNGVVLGYCAMNAWYKGRYNAKEIVPPDCYAFAEVIGDKEMAPHEDAPDKQNDLCSTCEKNQYGTAETGKGKACGNNIRLAILTENDVEDASSIASAEIATAKVSPTNLKHWSGYVKSIAEEYDRPPWAVVTEISAHEDGETQIRLEFRFVDLINDAPILEALEKREATVQETLQVPFAPATEKPAAKSSGTGRGAKFAAKPVVGKGRK